MIRDLYNLRSLLFSFALSSIGIYLENIDKDDEREISWDGLDNLIEIYLDKIYNELENKKIFINIY